MTETISRDFLVEQWALDHRRPPPKGISTRLLTLSYHYYRQVAQHGGQSPKTKGRLAAWAKNGNEPTHQEPKCSKRWRMSAGTRLVRDWKGTTHVVDVQEDGFIYEGTVYGSLSEIARVITGTRWSGPRFFGVRNR